MRYSEATTNSLKGLRAFVSAIAGALVGPFFTNFAASYSYSLHTTKWITFDPDNIMPLSFLLCWPTGAFLGCVTFCSLSYLRSRDRASAGAICLIGATLVLTLIVLWSGWVFMPNTGSSKAVHRNFVDIAVAPLIWATTLLLFGLSGMKKSGRQISYL